MSALRLSRYGIEGPADPDRVHNSASRLTKSTCSHLQSVRQKHIPLLARIAAHNPDGTSWREYRCRWADSGPGGKYRTGALSCARIETHKPLTCNELHAASVCDFDLSSMLQHAGYFGSVQLVPHSLQVRLFSNIHHADEQQNPNIPRGKRERLTPPVQLSISTPEISAHRNVESVGALHQFAFATSSTASFSCRLIASTTAVPRCSLSLLASALSSLGAISGSTPSKCEIR